MVTDFKPEAILPAMAPKSDDKLGLALAETHSLYAGELNQILDFCKSTDTTLTRKQKRSPSVKLNDRDKADILRIRDFIDATADKKKGSTEQNILIKSKAVSDLLMRFIIPMKHKGYLYEMALSYLVVHQESMLKDYLYGILVHRKEILRTEGQLSYQEALEVTSMKRLISLLAKREVDKLGYGGIDDADNYFEKRLGIKLSNFDMWATIVEASLRRNLFVHNKGVANKQYGQKTGLAKKGTKLSIDLDYVLDVGAAMQKFNDFCSREISKKLKIDEKSLEPTPPLD